MRHPRQLIRTLTVVVGVSVLVGASPSPATADLRGTAFVGAARLNETNKGTFGATVAFGGLLGVEFDVARLGLGTLAPGRGINADASLTTSMGNFVLRTPFGPLQPYATAGVGLVRVGGSVRAPGLGSVLSASVRGLGWNVGGGVYIVPNETFGVRVDLRRFQSRDVSWENLAGIGDVPLPEFDFWRGSVGLTVKF